METPSPQKSLTGDADPCPCCGHKRRRSDSPPVASSTVAAAEPPGSPISELDKRGSGAARQQPSPVSSPLPLKPAPSTSSVAQLVEPDHEGKHNKVGRICATSFFGFSQQPSPVSSPLPLKPAPSTSSVAQLVEPDPEVKHNKVGRICATSFFGLSQQPSPVSSPLPLKPASSTSSVAQLVEPDLEGKHNKEEKNMVEIKVAQGTQVTVSFKCKCGWCQEVFFS